MSKDNFQQLEAELQNDFQTLRDTFIKIREKLQSHADNKILKGDEVVGWLGEIYGKLLLGGSLVGDRNEHDIVTKDGWRVSVKTRKGRSWCQSSGIPKIDGDDCPTHLMFVRLFDDYRVHSIWLYEWKTIRSSGRFKEHIVRGARRSYIFHANEVSDRGNLIYSAQP